MYWHTRSTIFTHSIENAKALLYYSIASNSILSSIAFPHHDDHIDDLILSSQPCSFTNNLWKHVVDSSHIIDDHSLRHYVHFKSFQWSLTSPLPQTLAWDTEYNADPSTRDIITFLRSPNNADSPAPADTSSTIPDTFISSVDPAYHEPLREGRIQLLHHRLILLKTVFCSEKYLSLIIIPVGLCHKFFLVTMLVLLVVIWVNRKTLFCICTRFFWPHLRRDI